MIDTQAWKEKMDSLRSWENSLLRGERPNEARTTVDQRPAGPSTISNPGMAKPASPLPPGTRSADPNALPAHPQVAGSMRYDFAMPPDKDPLAQRHPLTHTNGRYANRDSRRIG